MRRDIPFDAIHASRKILRQARTGALATLDATGSPFATLVTVATESDGAPILLLSDLALHTANLTADPRASLLLEERGEGDPLQGGRISLTGRVTRLAEAPDATRRRFLARQPEAKFYAGFKDFAYWRMEVDAAHLVAGFGRIVTVPAADLLMAPAATAAMAAAETDILAHLNADHAATLALYATRLMGQSAGDWRALGIDADGLDLGLDAPGGLLLRRLPFVRQINDPGALPAYLKELADQARNSVSP